MAVFVTFCHKMSYFVAPIFCAPCLKYLFYGYHSYNPSLPLKGAHRKSLPVCLPFLYHLRQKNMQIP